MAMNDHGRGVADEANVYASVIEMDSRRVVVCSDHCDWLSLAVFLPQMSQGYSLVRVLRFWPSVDGVLWDIAHHFYVEEERG